MICFSWRGFPRYAARCVAAFAAQCHEKVVVVASRPLVPIKGMENDVGCPLIWVERNSNQTLSELLGEVPSALIVTGWGIPVSDGFCREVRDNCGRVFALVDNNFHNTFVEVVKSIRFRLFLRHRFDGFMVPGASGLRLMKFYGVPEQLTTTGMYAADAGLFPAGPSLSAREKSLVFVGQFCDRKNVLMLCNAFLAVPESKRVGWRLELFGCGPLETQIPQDPSILKHGFLQPEELSQAYRRARCFVLPSKDEHWGLVVHEAALSGCALMLSDQVGAADDLLEDNGWKFSPNCVGDLRRCLMELFALEDSSLDAMGAASISAATRFSPLRFVRGINRLLEMKR